MTITIERTSIKQDLLICIAIISLVFIIAVQSISLPIFIPASKIEEGTIVNRNDSVVTIIIPDKL